MCIRDSGEGVALSEGDGEGEEVVGVALGVVELVAALDPPPSEAWREITTTRVATVSYTHLRAHETVLDLVCRLLLEKTTHTHTHNTTQHNTPTKLLTTTLHQRKLSRGWETIAVYRNNLQINSSK